MADRIELFEITTAAGTLQTAPLSTALDMLEGRLDVIELTIPPGHAGLTGIAFFHSGVQVIPKRAGAFVRGDGQTINWPIARYPTGAKWTVQTFNTDVFDHVHLLRILLTDVEQAVAVAPYVPSVVVTPEVAPDELAAAEELPPPTQAELDQLSADQEQVA